MDDVLTIFAVLAALPLVMTAGAGCAELPPGRALIAKAGLLDAGVSGSDEARSVQKITVKGRPFSRALRVHTRKVPEQSHNIQAIMCTVAPVKTFLPGCAWIGRRRPTEPGTRELEWSSRDLVLSWERRAVPWIR